MENPRTKMRSEPPQGWVPLEVTRDVLTTTLDAFAATAMAPMFLLLRTRPMSPGAILELVNSAYAYPLERTLPMSAITTDYVALGDITDSGQGAALEQIVERLVLDFKLETAAIIPLRDGTPTVSLGRSGANQVPVKHVSISKVHALFRYDPNGGLWLSDRGSKNGTSINDERLVGEDEAKLENGDRIGLGRLGGSVADAVTLWKVLDKMST